MNDPMTGRAGFSSRPWLIPAVALIALVGFAIGLRAQQSSESEKESDTMTQNAETDAADDRATAQDMSADGKKLARATFAAGCFWGIEAAFRKIEGVKATSVGFTGGNYKNPTYKEVCSGQTGHAEAVRVVFDPEEISYEDLLKTFWKSHDPTQLNRQGPDFGTQYRTAIFFHSPEQKKLAEETKKILQENRKFGKRKIVTQIEPADSFYLAEDYHQKYLEKRGLASCHVSLQ